MAGSDEAGDRHLFRDADEHHRLPAFPYAHREHRRVSKESSHRHDSGVAVRSGRGDDLRPAAGLLHPEATKKERANRRGKAPARFLWFLQPLGRPGHSAPMAGAGRFLSFLAGWRVYRFAPEAAVLSGRRPILVLPRHLAAERCALDRDQRRCSDGGAGRPSDCGRFGENGIKGGIGKASPYFHDEFHWGWWTTLLVLHLSRSSTDKLCASHRSSERQRGHAETDRTSSSRIEQTGAGSVDHRAAAANKSCRDSGGDSHFGSGGHRPPHGEPGHTNASDASFASHESCRTVTRSCGAEG